MTFVVAEETFGGMRLALERIADEASALDVALAAERDAGDARFEELCPYYGLLWPSARALAERLVELGPAALAGRRVLELGCGLAAPSLVAARLGAQVLATDYHPHVAGLLAGNAARNQIGGVSYAQVDWRHEAALPRGFDLVLAADVLYLPELAPLVARAIERGLAPGGRALVADQGRPALQPFVDLLTARGFRCDLDVRSVPDPPRPRRDVFVLSLARD